MSQEEKRPEETVAAAAIEAPAADQIDTVSKLQALQQRFYDACNCLFGYMEYIGEPMYNLMLKHYFEQYKREYELMNAAEFIRADKRIEELQAERERELEEVKLFRDKQKRELEMAREQAIKAIELEKVKLTELLAMQREKELEEVKLEHQQLKAEIQRKREKLNNEIEILWQTTVIEDQMKASRIIPDSWRRCHIGKWHFGKLIKNEAMQYAEIAAGNEIEAYLARRAEQVSEITGEEVEEAVPLSAREYKRWEKRFEKEQRKRRKESAEQLDVHENEDAGEIEMPVQGAESDTAADVSLIAEDVESD